MEDRNLFKDVHTLIWPEQEKKIATLQSEKRKLEEQLQNSAKENEKKMETLQSDHKHELEYRLQQAHEMAMLQSKNRELEYKIQQLAQADESNPAEQNLQITEQQVQARGQC